MDTCLQWLSCEDISEENWIPSSYLHHTCWARWLVTENSVTMITEADLFVNAS